MLAQQESVVVARPQEPRLFATLAYGYGFPLVLMEVTREIITSSIGRAPKGPMNQFVHVRSSRTPRTGIVRPNVDTLYSSAFLDFAAEPSCSESPIWGSATT